MAKIKRQYGPFNSGYRADVDRFMVPPDAITADSRNWRVRSSDGALVRRGGTSIVGDAISPQVGLLETKFGARPRQFLELSSPSLSATGTHETGQAAGYPTRAVLYGTDYTGTLTARTMARGQLYFSSHNTNPATNQVPGKSFGSTHYGTGSAPPNFRMIPMPYRDGYGAVGLTRGISAADRTRMAPGSRNVTQVGDRVLFPNLEGAPWGWDKRFNDASGSGTEKERHYPMGHIPPLWPGTVTAAGELTTPAIGPFKENTVFYHTVAFIFADKSWSMPCIPRGTNAIHTSGFGRYVIPAAAGSAGANTHYSRLEFRNIPKGPPGCIGRAVCWTVPVDIASDSDPDLISGFGILGIIWNNVQTSFDATSSNHTINDELLRFDHEWPDSARYIGTARERVVLSYLKPNPCALIIASVGGDTSYNMNGDEDFVTSEKFGVKVDATNVILIKDGSSVANIARTLTLQSIVDTINETVGVAGVLTPDQFRAQLVPGADADALGTDLMQTIHSITNCSHGNGVATVTSTTTDAFANLAVGMEITSANHPANTYIVSVDRSDNKTLTLSANSNGSAGPVTIVFQVDTGDDGAFSTTAPGVVRCFTNAMPCILPFNKAYLDRVPTLKNGHDFSGASPGHPRNAENNFYVGNYRPHPSYLGHANGPCMDLPTMGILPASRGMGRIYNVRGNDTGDDDDFQLSILNPTRGCTSPFSCGTGDGWAHYLTDDGLVVTDGTREVVISLGVYNPDFPSASPWAYEIAQCATATGGDVESGNGDIDFYFTAKVMSGKLYISFRSDANTLMQQVYDFSPGLANQGLAQVLQPDGKPYPWGAPEKITAGSVMGEVRTAAGVKRYIAIEGNSGSTGDGRIDQMETGTADNGTVVAPVGWTMTDICDHLGKKALVEVQALVRKNGTGLTIHPQRDLARGSQGTLTPGTSGSLPFLRKRLPPALADRSFKEAIEFKIADDGSGTSAEIWMLDCEVELSEVPS